MFQNNLYLSETNLDGWSIIEKITETKTDAMYYLTVLTSTELSKIQDSAIDKLVLHLKQVKTAEPHRKLIVRLMSEMNGNWFRYGQNPTLFKSVWKRVVDKTRNSVSGIAFIFAPNMGAGYPFGSFSGPLSDLPILDTNGDGKLNILDDPYTPYYPGDNYVDWVGLSVYHFGTSSPWVDNVLPPNNQVENVLTGKASSPFDFYNMFSVERGKPFMFVEFGAAFHLSFLNGGWISPGPGELAIKQAFWRQALGILTKYPKIKGLCFFDWKKDEGDTLRDFRVLANPDIYNALSNDLKSLGNLIIWAQNI